MNTTALVRISALVDLHDSNYHAAGLRLVFGDGLLCRSSSVFLRARRSLSKRGFRLSCRASAVRSIYDSVALLALPEILAAHTVPYTDNVSGLRAMCRSGRDVRAPIGFFLQNMRRSHILHETAHCITHAMTTESSVLISRPILAALLAESVANTLETLVVTQASEPLTKFAAHMNVYASVTDPSRRSIREYIRIRGTRSGFCLLVLGYMLTNLLLDPCSATSVRRIAQSIKLRRDEDVATIVPVLAHCATLDWHFRRETARIHFAAEGRLRELKNAWGKPPPAKTWNTLVGVTEVLADELAGH